MAGMLAMIIGPKGAKQYERETGNKLGNLEEADRMLGDREWKSLTRDEKLAIRKMTGWQIGPGGDWMFETDRDPSLSEGFKRKYGDRYSYRDAEIAKTKKVADEVRRVRDSYRQLVKERGLSGNESYGEEFLPAEVLWDTPETMANHMRIWRGLLKDTMHESDPVKMSFLNDKKLLKAEADLAAHMETGKGRPDFSPYEGTLGDVLDFDRTPELLAAYPGLDKVKLRIEEREDGTLGEWNNETKTLTMTRRALEEKGLQGSLGTLLHELTHRVQDSEGFANGGSYLSTIFNRPSEIYWSFKSPTPENLPKRPDNYFYFGGSNPVVDNPASRVDRVMEQFWNLSSRNADYAERHPDDTAPLHSPHDFRKFIGPAWEGFHKGQYGLPDLTPLPEGNLSDPEVMNAWKEENYAIIRTALDGIMEPIRAYDSAVARAKEAERIEKERQDAINKTILEMQKRYDTSTNAIQDKGLGKYDELYRRIAGETGARNSELRMKMSQEERMGSLLEDTEDRKRAEQIDSRFGFGNAVDPESFDEILREHPRMLQQAAKGGDAGRSKSSRVRQTAGGGATKISYEDLRKLADATYKGDIRAAVYSLDPKVVTATVDSFGGNIDRTNRPMYVHRDKDGKITGYSTTNSGDALDRGVKKGNGDTILGKLKKRIGETGEVLDYGLAWMERQAAETANMDVPVLSKMADAVVSPALVGARAALANVTSGGGKHYQPEVRDEKHFSKAALRELGETVKSMRGRTLGRADGIDNAAQFNLTQTIGGFSVMNGAVTDKFDINKHYHGVPDALTSVARTVLGREEDPDAGKVKTRIPLTALGLRQAAKAGDAGSSKSSGVPSGHNPALDGYSGPRIVVNPSTFRDERDGLCVAFDESFRILMEVNGFDPVSEPTEKQRAFFADTAYNDDERMLRRTILARICTFDTSVTDPTDEQLQEAVEFLDTVLEIGAPQNQWEQRAVERIRTAISKALESGERVPASQAPAPEGSPEVAAGGAGSSAGGVPEDEEKDSGAEFRENAQAQMDEAAKLAQEGPTAEEQKVREMADAAGKAAGDDPFGKSAEMKAAAQEAGLRADIAEAQKPENLMQKNRHYVDAQGRVISERAAKELAEQNAGNAAAQDTNDKQQVPVAGMDAAQNSPRTASERIGTTSGIKAPGGRELTAGEAAWQARKQASTAAWMQRTSRSGDGVADALAQRDERANNLRQSTQVDSGRRDALGRKLDDRGRVIA